MDGSSSIPAHGWLWLISAPVCCASSSFAPSVLAPARLRLLFVSALDSVRLIDGSSPVPAHGWLWLISAPAHLHLQFWLQLVCGSCLFLLWIQSGSWTAPARFQLIAAPAHGWLWLISAPVPCGCSSFAPSGPAPGGLHLLGSFGSSPLTVPARFCLQLLGGSSSGSSPSPSQLVLVQLLLAFGQVVNQSLSWLVYEYELS